MEKLPGVPDDATFNEASNQWELGPKNSKGEKTGEWKYWWATTGHFCCHTFLDETTNTLTYTRFHPHGTWSQKGTLVNGVLEGTIQYQKSANDTTEQALTEPLYKNVFRVSCEVKNGTAIWWQYFNEAHASVDLNGRLNTTQEEFATTFPDKQVPQELALLLTFEQRYGRGNYSPGFSLSAKGTPFIAGWSQSETFLNRFIPFAKANDYGAVYACWDNGNNKPFNKQPVVVFGDEGGVHVVAESLFELLQLLTADKRMYVTHDGITYKDNDASPYAPDYKKWVKDTFNINPIDNPRVITASAQDAFKISFDTWLSQYHITITEKEANERFQLSDYIETSHGDEYRYILLEGDVIIEGLLDLNTRCQSVNTHGIIVNGNLTIKGVLFETEVDYGEIVFVTGNLYARSISKSGGEFYIKGNLVVEQTIYGFYDFGHLTVKGTTTAAIIFAEEQNFTFGGEVQGLIINNTEPLLDELIQDDKHANSILMLEYIIAGRSIIK